MKYIFKKTSKFTRSFGALPLRQQELAREKFKVFRSDPWGSLGAHRIARLSDRAKHTIYAVRLEGDLRVVFRLDGNVITSLDIGTHQIYQ